MFDIMDRVPEPPESEYPCEDWQEDIDESWYGVMDCAELAEVLRNVPEYQ